MKKRRVGILASGGDGSGMNACIYYLTKYLEDGGFDVVHFESGYDGLCNNVTTNMTARELRRQMTGGGCIIKAGRSSLYMTEKGCKMAASNMKKNGLDCVVVVGGNGSIKGLCDGAKFGLVGIGIPATLDNDVFFSDYSLGYDSAANANISLVKAVKTSGFSTNKLCIVEVMGRNCGKLALATAIGTGADICVVKEVPKTCDDVIAEIKKLKAQGKENLLIVVAEKNLNLEELIKKSEEAMGKEVRSFVSGYAQRGADASAFDRYLAASFAHEAVKLIKQKKYMVTVGFRGGTAFTVPIETILDNKANFDYELYKSLY